MKLTRNLMMVFMLVILTAGLFGWNWSARLGSPQIIGARSVLGMIMIFSIAGMVILWKAASRREQ